MEEIHELSSDLRRQRGFRVSKQLKPRIDRRFALFEPLREHLVIDCNTA
jgi:hypothetical protein